MLARLGRLVGSWLKARPYTILTFVVLLVLLVPFLRRPNADWSRVYVKAGERLLAGKELYADLAYTYPPLAAWMAVPFSLLPREAGQLAWYGVNVAALVVLLRGAWRLSGGGRLQGRGVPWREHGILLLGLACAFGYAVGVFGNQQTDLIVAALVIGGCWWLSQGRSILSAIALGVAAGLKCTPLLWAPYLVWRGRWRAALVVVAVAAAVNLLPDAIHPPASGTPRLVEWVRIFLVPMGKSDHLSGSWNSSINFNHSLAGVCNRWLLKTPVLDKADMPFVERADPASPRTLKMVVAGSGGAFMILALLAARRRPFGIGELKSVFPEAAAAIGLPSRDSVEFGLVMILMLLLSPMSSKPHFCTLLLPGWCLARFVMQRRSLVLGGLLVITVASGLLIHEDLVGNYVSNVAVWYGSVFWQAVLLFVGSCGVLIRLAWLGAGKVVKPNGLMKLLRKRAA